MLGENTIFYPHRFKFFKIQQCLNCSDTFFSLAKGPSELDNFTDELRGVIPRSFEYIFFLINREVERVSFIISFHADLCFKPMIICLFSNETVAVFVFVFFFSFSLASLRVFFANVHLLRFTMNKFMTSWTRPQPAFSSGRTSRKVCLLRELWRSLSTLLLKPTRYKHFACCHS